VKNFIRIGGIILVAFSILLSSTGTFASEEGILMKTHGPIMKMDSKKNIMVVNEKTFIWNKSTVFNDDKGSITGIEKFKTKSWVFIEGETEDQYIVIKKIYLLPKHVGKKERHLYPFMQ
jgi:hypothetical protein